ncbi:hypothetical protein IE53DRAFT_381971 [Violaceomyces palustris]|uniref:Uncharacterized protein n=1 Tax=Violaceomyces palustris TaxID=1673888 RepID=A0ACD0NPD8_9BASI|nr:hypothetical protein IE53DRAFT_381971 [Violaceomyces palustris]
MKAAFRGLRRKSSASEAEHKHGLRAGSEALPPSPTPQVPRLPPSQKSNANADPLVMPSLRFSGLGLDHMLNVNFDPSPVLDLQTDDDAVPPTQAHFHIGDPPAPHATELGSNEPPANPAVQRKGPLIFTAFNAAQQATTIPPSPEAAPPSRHSPNIESYRDVSDGFTYPSSSLQATRGMASGLRRPTPPSSSQTQYGLLPSSQSPYPSRSLAESQAPSSNGGGGGSGTLRPPGENLENPRSIRRSTSQPSFGRPQQAQASSGVNNNGRAPQFAPPPPRATTSKILESTKSIHQAKSHTGRRGPTPTPSSKIEPPTLPSLFAYENGPGSGLRNNSIAPKSAGHQSSSASRSIAPSRSERETVRNARGEIEWKDKGPSPSAPPPRGGSDSVSQERRLPKPSSKNRSPNQNDDDDRDNHGGSRSASPPPNQNRVQEALARAAGPPVPYIPIGAAVNPQSSATPPRSPRLRTRDNFMEMGGRLMMMRTSKKSKSLRDIAGQAKSDKARSREMVNPSAGGEEEGGGWRESRQQREAREAEEERWRAEKWEREQEAKNAADRLAVQQRKRAEEALREQEERMARKKAERAAAAAQAERLAKEREEREEREARQAAEKLERDRREKVQRLAEKAARREARAKAEVEAEERRQRELKEAEEREVRLEKVRLEEEARRVAEEKAREEAEREAKVKAAARAKQEAIQREIEARQEESRRLVEARRQVEEEDREARRAGRRDAKRSAKALVTGLALDSPDQDDDDEEFYSDQDSADFTDAVEMDRSQSGVRAPSSTDGSNDLPRTPADEFVTSPASLANLLTSPEMAGSSAEWQKFPKQGDASSLGEGCQAGGIITLGGSVHFSEPSVTGARNALGSERQPSPVPPKTERFKTALKSGSRRVPPVTTPPPTLLSQLAAIPSANLADDGDDDDDEDEDEEEYPEIVQPRGLYREGGITYGRGWCAHGLADPTLIINHKRYVRSAKTKVEVECKEEEEREKPDENEVEDASEAEQEVEVTEDEEYEEIMYDDLGELIWTSTTPDVLARLVSHLDYADIKSLRQTSQSIRFALDQLAGREIVLNRFLSQVGYRSWQPTRLSKDPKAPLVVKDPLPLSFSDCEAFLLSQELLPEYHLVGAEYARAPHQMDPRYPRLARATTRSYNRVLARLRAQPSFSVPAIGMNGVLPPSSVARSPSLGLSQSQQQHQQQTAFPSSPTLLTRSGSYFVNGQGQNHASGLSPINPQEPFSPPSPGGMANPSWSVGERPIPTPWKPGRAAFFRVWVPCSEAGGWLSDGELSKCERELFIAGVWSWLKRGDVVWDCAVGDSKNEGKYIFDGRYLRDLSFMFDKIGHLPSWINSFSYAPSYYHNLIRSSNASQPVIYLDVLPWRDQIVSTMRLVQDQVETFSAQGARYRISKWLYRAVVEVTSGQIISNEGLEVVDEGWKGRLVIETEGTAEHAKELISRCSGPLESASNKARLLASVSSSSFSHEGDQDSRGTISKLGIGSASHSSLKTVMSDDQGKKVETTTPWAIIRARSRPGLIWIRPIDMREKVVY